MTIIKPLQGIAPAGATLAGAALDPLLADLVKKRSTRLELQDAEVGEVNVVARMGC